MPHHPTRRAMALRLATSLFAAPLLGASAPAGAAPSLCERGRRQAPIDIVNPTITPSLPPLRFDYRVVPLVLVHDGHTIRIRIPPGSVALLGREGLPLTQIHFHLPGGDRIAGEEFPMALHLLHRSRAGQLVSVVAPFRTGPAHAGLRALLPNLPRAGLPEQRPAGVTLDAAAFVPGPTAGYFQYDGSLTAPPCTEGVRWLVLKQPQTLSAEQLQALQHLIQNNARAVQPLNDRTVQASP